MKLSLIEFALSELNKKNNGDKIFEKLCFELIKKAFDPNIIAASGLDNKGDGGVDAWSLDNDKEKIKYAFSIQQKSNAKIEAEIIKTDITKYPSLIIMINQPVTQKIKEDLSKLFTGKKITIYDKENIAHFIQDFEEIGDIIGLPKYLAEVNMNYARKHSQFISEEKLIHSYIPRTIRYNNKDKEDDLFLVANCTNFTVLQSSAGYGKSCILKQLYLELLVEKDCNVLPPVLIELKNYIPSKLTEMVKDLLRVGGDYFFGDCFLLLDGFDEVKDEYKADLLKELLNLITNNSYNRKVLISVRENTLSDNSFSGFNPIEYVYLEPLNNDDIRLLLKKNNITEPNNFLSDSNFLGFSDNIYYAVNFIEFYKENKTIAKDVVDLYEFIIEQEFKNIYKNKESQNIDFESLSLYMTLNQDLKITIDDIEVFDGLESKLPFYPFKFSHKSIQEFLAAKKLSRLSITDIEKIIIKSDQVINHLSNMLGFLLNILCSGTDEDLDKFDKLLEKILKGKGNAQKLIKIERDKINEQDLFRIFKAILKEEAVVGNLFDMPQGLSLFISENDDSKQFLVDCIVDIQDLTGYSWNYYTYLLQKLIYTNSTCLSEKQHHQLIDFFLQILDDKKIIQFTDLIDSLYFSLCYSPELNTLTEKQLEFVVIQTLKVRDKSSLINNLSRFLLNSKLEISYELFIKIFDYIAKEKEHDGAQIAGTVPDQIGDDYSTATIRLVYIDDFFVLSEKIFENNSFFWSFLEYMTKTNIYELSYSQYDTLYSKILNKLDILFKNNLTDNRNILIFLEWVIKETNEGKLNYIWNDIKLLFDNNLELAYNVIESLSLNFRDYIFYRKVYDYLLEEFKIENNFKFFYNKFTCEPDLKVKNFLKQIFITIPETHEQYHFIYELLPKDIQNALQKYILRNKELDVEQNNTDDDKKILDSIHTIFDVKTLKHDIQSIFKLYDVTLLNKDYFRKYENYKIFDKCDKKFPFATYMILDLFKSEDIEYSEEFIFQFFDSKGWKRNFIIYLISFMSDKKLSYNELHEDESVILVNWINQFLSNYPITLYSTKIYREYLFISKVLRVSEIFESNDISEESMLGFAFSGFPIDLSGCFISSYDSYSIDYLEKYINRSKLISYIVKNFDFDQITSNAMLSICGYILNRFDNLNPVQRRSLKEQLISYFNVNLINSYQTVVRDLYLQLGGKITDLDRENFINALRFDKDNHLDHNYAASFLMYPIKNIYDKEYQYFIKLVYDSWSRAEEQLKLRLSFYLLKMDKLSDDVFKYFVDCMLDGATIKNDFALEGAGWQFSTADIGLLDSVEELLEYSIELSSKSTRRNVLLDLALGSYKLMASNASTFEDFTKIVSSMEKVQKQGKDFLLKHIRDIENAYTERTYKPLSFNDILLLNEEVSN